MSRILLLALEENLHKDNWQNRTELLLGREDLKKLERSHVLIAGLGGVGGHAAEQLARAGIGEFTLIDNDSVHPSNRNRQLIALKSTHDQMKTELFQKRLKDINPTIRLHIIQRFLTEENIPELFDTSYDYIIDAIDTLSPKVNLLRRAVENKFPVISSMGSGGRKDPGLVQVCDISNSHHCKFAYKIRKEIHKYGIRNGIKVVFSPEKVSKNSLLITDGSNNKRSIVGTISYMPAIFGCYIAAEVIQDIINTSESLS